MKIVFVSKLMATSAAGPNWSVPARIKAQADIDEVFWVNLDESIMPHWLETGLYHSLNDLGGKLSLDSLPKPFSSPDVVIFEVPFFPQYLRFASELRKRGVPYIIVPRCSFTRQALNNHSKWKKKIGGWLFFNKFFKGAKAIQYLTINELNDSTPFICPESFIIPNGITLPKRYIKEKKYDGLVGIYIGRIDIYHKGLDLLLNSIVKNIDFLRKNKVRFDIYGPENSDYFKLKNIVKTEGVEDIFCLKGEVSGKDKEVVLQNADFFIMTSRFEGQPMAMLEALAYGVPCIASDGTYMRKIIEEYNAGYGCNNCENSIGDAIKSLIINRDKLVEMRENACTVSSKYQWSEVAIELHDKLSELIDIS